MPELESYFVVCFFKSQSHNLRTTYNHNFILPQRVIFQTYSLHEIQSQCGNAVSGVYFEESGKINLCLKADRFMLET